MEQFKQDYMTLESYVNMSDFMQLMNSSCFDTAIKKGIDENTFSIERVRLCMDNFGDLLEKYGEKCKGRYQMKDCKKLFDKLVKHLETDTEIVIVFAFYTSPYWANTLYEKYKNLE